MTHGEKSAGYGDVRSAGSDPGGVPPNSFRGGRRAASLTLVSDLSVPKHRVEVRIAVGGGDWRTVVVFLAAQAEDHAGPERVSDLLERDEAFFPAQEVATGETWFVSRAALSAIRIPRGVERDEDALTIPTEHQVEVVLRDGERLRGAVFYVLPRDRSRVVDFLNVAPHFFPLLSPDGDVLLVNRAHVARVVLASP